jgi:broad specificity phosphatase PhoE
VQGYDGVSADILWLMRHGQREDHVDLDWAKTAARPLDPALSLTGVEQARAVAHRLAAEGITRIFTSPYLRCAETAHLVAAVLGVPVHVEPGIGELHHPDWSAGLPELLTLDDLAVRTGAFDHGHAALHEPVYPETIEEAFARAEATARKIAERYDGTLLLVGHAVSVTGIVRGLTKDDGEVPCPEACVKRLEREGASWRLAATD